MIPEVKMGKDFIYAGSKTIEGEYVQKCEFQGPGYKRTIHNELGQYVMQIKERDDGSKVETCVDLYHNTRREIHLNKDGNGTLIQFSGDENDKTMLSYKIVGRKIASITKLDLQTGKGEKYPFSSHMSYDIWMGTPDNLPGVDSVPVTASPENLEKYKVMKQLSVDSLKKEDKLVRTQRANMILNHQQETR